MQSFLVCVVALVVLQLSIANAQSCSNDTLKIQQNGIPRLTIDSTGTVTVPSGSLSLNGGLDGFQLLQNFGQDIDVGTYSSIAIGTDGFPLISFYDAKNKDLKVAHCKNALCNGTTIFTLDNVGDVGQYSKITIGNDGLGLISYYDLTNLALKVAHCSDLLCSSATITTIDTGNVGRFSAITTQATGNVLITYYSDSLFKLRIASCNNVLCTSATIRTLTYASANYGLYSGVVYNPADSLSIISFYDVTNGDLVISKCNDITCTTSTNNLLESTNDVGSWNVIAMLPTDTSPWIAHVQAGAAVRVTRCASVACTSGSSFTVDGITTTAQWLSLRGDSNGYPIVAYQENVAGGRLRVSHCLNAACLPSGVLVYVANNTGANMTSLVLGSDGLPMITYYNSQTQDLFAAHCSNLDCSASTLVNVACCDRNQFAINRGLTQLFAVDDTGAIANTVVNTLQTAIASCNGDGVCGAKETLSCSDCKTNCLDIMLAGNSVGDGQYQIISANGTRMRIFCDMTRVGGGWTLISKLYYLTGYTPYINLGTDSRTGGNIFNGAAFGTIEDGINNEVSISYQNYLTGLSWYKVSDNDIRNSIIGSTNNFDVMFDQVGSHPSYNVGGNFEVVVMRNYTAIYTFNGTTAASSTPITVTSYRADTGAVMSSNLTSLTGFACGAAVGAIRGIGCVSSQSVTPSFCSNYAPAGNPNWSLNLIQFYSNGDTYLYACGGNMASSNAGYGSGWKVAHRVWIRRRYGNL